MRKSNGKLAVGPGGYKCDCCRHGYCKKDFRVKTNRMDRRKNKTDLKKLDEKD